MTAPTAEELRSLFLFEALTPEQLQWLVQRGDTRTYEAGVSIYREGEPATHLQGNATLLGELVRNLVDNAINYTPVGGHVTVRLMVDRFSGILVLIVEDSGPGIPESERELVFQPFYRALGTNVDGSGLGLAIVQEIAQQHGASITLEDADLPGHPDSPGTRVTLRFVGMA